MDSKKDDPVVGLDKMGEPIIDPAPDKPPTWEDTVTAKSLFRGGNWGLAIGLMAALVYTSAYSRLGLLDGYDFLMLGCGAGFGYVLGAFVGWLLAKITGRNVLPPTSLFDR